jgi:hypothetical protein
MHLAAADMLPSTHAAWHGMAALRCADWVVLVYRMVMALKGWRGGVAEVQEILGAVIGPWLGVRSMPPRNSQTPAAACALMHGVQAAPECMSLLEPWMLIALLPRMEIGTGAMLIQLAHSCAAAVAGDAARPEHVRADGGPSTLSVLMKVPSSTYCCF